jgi:hypothetical protein
MRRPPGRIAATLTAVLMIWVVGGGEARADRIVLKSGEVIEGSVIEATRNTVIVLRSIGGMRQMPIQEIEEVRVDLAQGQQIVGELLGWADGVYEVRSGDEIVRVGESGIVSREPRQQTARLLPTRPRGAQPSTAAAAPSSAPAEQRAESAAAPTGRAEQARSTAAADVDSDAAAAAPERAAADGGERQRSGTEAQTAAARQNQPSATEAPAAAERENQAAATRQRLAAAARQSQPSATEAPAAAETEDEAEAERPRQPAAAAQTPAEAEPEETQAAAGAQEPAEAEPGTQTAAAAEAAPERESQAAAGEQQAALGDSGTLAVKASVDPPAPGARNLVFNIELSQPAKQTVVLIYGTVDGTAKAGEDYEAQQGMVTLAPGARTAEVRVPLIEGAPEAGDKRFELVLMADPKVAEVVDRRVIATIKGTD